MNKQRTFLDFEQPVGELETRIAELRQLQSENAVDIGEEIALLERKSEQLTRDIYAQLTPWQITKLARHPDRPYTLDYIRECFTDFQELHGDRNFADDQSIVGGLARFEGEPCIVIGHQKGRDTRERTARNFGMPRPEGYRKALRLMRMAEKFALPVFTFIDTPGAYPGIDAEERGQSEAIGRNIYEMARLRTPTSAPSSVKAAAAARSPSLWPTRCSCSSTRFTPSSVPKAAPPSSGKPATRRKTPPKHSASPPSASRPSAWWTPSSPNPSAARKATTRPPPPPSLPPSPPRERNSPPSPPTNSSSAATSA